LKSHAIRQQTEQYAEKLPNETPENESKHIAFNHVNRTSAAGAMRKLTITLQQI